jgi:hypothetical protein
MTLLRIIRECALMATPDYNAAVVVCRWAGLDLEYIGRVRIIIRHEKQKNAI